MYHQAGYFLIAMRPYGFAGETPLCLPTVSPCINDCFPDTWALPWSFTPPELKARLQPDYGIDERKLTTIQAWADKAFSAGELGWPNLLLTEAGARNFYRDFLSPLKLRLLGLALPADQLEIALATLRPSHPSEGRCGLYSALLEQMPEPESGSLLGYELMGLEVGGSLHSFYCNDLQTDYARLGLSLNAHGLLASERDAHLALEYTLAETTGAEPVPWLSFRVREYSL